MRKLKFDRNRYSNGLLIDSADMSTFDGSIVEAVPDFHVIGIIEAGNGTLLIGEHRVKVRPGTIITISPGLPVDLSGCSMDRATWIFFEAGFLDILYEEAHFTYKFSFFHDLEAAPAMRPVKRSFQACNDLAREIHGELRKPSGDSESFLRAALPLLLVRLQRAHAVDGKHDVGVFNDARIQRLRYLLANKLTELRTVETIAEELGISRGHLHKLAQRHFGRSAKLLIEDHRMLQARRALLFTDADVATIAFDLGYTDPSNFARSFRRHMGLAPVAYRAKATY
ncbi:MAG TPA: AraC family transcriptional regulator [Flavobacteriales bacterium]|nr:AraC family transcriptional regulator [Flavobacteriales bacterium]HNU57355.1 AraC family transcriptional regulator [Flavobacteriales bacterium]